MNEVDNAYMAYKAPEEDYDPWEFLAQQIRGLIALVIIVLSVWMLVAAVVLK